MTKHFSTKRRESMKLFSTFSVFLFMGFLILLYFYKSPPELIDNKQIVATTTTPPVIKKPLPKNIATSTELSLSITPRIIKQGEPALITVEGLTSTSSVKSFTFNNRPLVFFIYQGQVVALLGVDLRSATGTFPVLLTFNDGKQIKEDFIISERVIVKKPFDIPDKLGGNTPESEKELISTLAKETKIINSIPTANEKLWTDKFRSPLDSPLEVEDPYGYTRITGKSTLSHKGVDLEASLGTSVYSMNKGVVKFSGNLRNYGNVVVVDHGLGLQIVYMHLSEIKVTSGQVVEKGELVGLSGDTGYVLGPHLHLTVKIWDISIDPLKFLELLG